MIASSVSIRVNGAIRANGGSIIPAGSGGAIRLVAPTMTGPGVLQAFGGSGLFAVPKVVSGSKRSRIHLLAQASGVARATTLLPAPILLPTGPQPQLRVVSVGGQAVPATPQRRLQPCRRHHQHHTGGGYPARGAEHSPGTPITVTVANETEGSQVVSSSPLAGTAALSTATCNRHDAGGLLAHLQPRHMVAGPVEIRIRTYCGRG